MGEVSWLGGTILPGAPEEKASGWEKVLSPLAGRPPPSFHRAPASRASERCKVRSGWQTFKPAVLVFTGDS